MVRSIEELPPMVFFVMRDQEYWGIVLHDLTHGGHTAIAGLVERPRAIHDL
jgi:hypothetical protein